ncbi:response regulator transcription factor [Mucilaginibacter polytrichastri]|uniref:HTH luxR-type domain-containing protein n=1 Tax=Mucilaginibacter polytrichastri TaxID=1302689 RepID=A0A1Q5ZSU4_9SPHI|nr:LuxR C-terminal-related transcriptional regulator [Mucilaginibacter polytrichastri]OKS84817.1 hypothetical protein RG47T_0252 [Mucilaginibacter polytrichastri]SFS49054.1 regulatory protein, luxR family [Mucilaginibacter polytrichastri]
MEHIRELLDIKLLGQSFNPSSGHTLSLENAKVIAQLYSKFENGISVLSDMKTRKSYIYYGAVADVLGLTRRQNEINSIWEDELLDVIHTDDLQKKYRLELLYFQLLNTIAVNDRSDYEIITKLRIQRSEGITQFLKHRLLYISSSPDNSIWLALCLYNLIPDYPGFDAPDGLILNTRTGRILGSEEKFPEILSSREKEIMQLIRQGKRSKEIAEKLTLSINTVNRHRQNIFQKLNVSNAIEACRVVEAIELL